MRRISIIIFAASLTVATAAQSAQRRGVDAPEGAAGNPDKVICKTFTRIGTLAGRYRTCKTKAEWERERENLRQVNVSDSCGRRGELGGASTPNGSGNTYDC